jgi:O-antigen/teichoic acid export membrane protein
MSFYNSGKARRSLIDTVSYRALSQLATVLGLVVMVRAMPKEDFGVFNLLYAFIPVISTVASLGLEQVLRRYQPEYLRAGNVAGAAWLVRFVVSTRFATNILVMAAVLLAWNLIAPIFKLGEYRTAFASFTLLALLFFQSRILQLSLSSHMLHRFAVGSVAILSVAKLIAYVVMAWFGTLTLEKAILADTIGYVLSYAFLSIAHRKYAKPDVPVSNYRPPPQERRRLIRYGVYNNFNDAGVLLLYSTADNFFIAAFIDPISVGVYAFYTRLNLMTLNLLPLKLFDNIVQPMLFSLSREDASRRMPQIFSFLLNMNFMIQWPVFAFALAYHAEIVQVVFGGKFIEHSWLLPLIVGFATLNVIADPVTLVAQYEEKAGIILLSKLTALYNLLALFLLVPALGIYGAALASGSSQALKNFFIWWHVRDRARWINVGAALLSSVAVWGAAVAVCYALKYVLPVHALVQLILGGVIFAVAGLIYIRTPALSASDRTILGSVLKGREGAILQRLGLLMPAK